MLLLRLWAQMCSLLLESLCFWVLSVDRVRKSLHACTHRHVLTHVPTCIHLHVCVHTYTCALRHAYTQYRYRLHTSDFTAIPPILVRLRRVLLTFLPSTSASFPPVGEPGRTATLARFSAACSWDRPKRVSGLLRP